MYRGRQAGSRGLLRSLPIRNAPLCGTANVISTLAQTTRRVLHVGVQVSWRSGGSDAIVRRLICLLYTAGGLLSGIPFYGVPYGVRRAREGAPCERDTCCYITSPIVVAAQPRAIRPSRGTVSVGERRARRHGEL